MYFSIYLKFCCFWGVIGLPAEQPIGIFDSGVGGLTVAKLVIERLPAESIVYVGDTAHVPYGDKTHRELVAYANQITRFLVRKGVKVIIAACNTSSAVSIDIIRRYYPVPIMGVIEPGVRRAVEITRERKIGVLATEATTRSGAFSRAVKALAPQVGVWVQACPRLVPLVEEGKLEGPEVEAACAEYVEPLCRTGVDTIILGCTHYPFLAPVIQRVAGEKVTLVDPAVATVEEVKEFLSQQGLLHEEGNPLPHYEFYASGPVDSFYKVGTRMIGEIARQVKRVQLD